LPDARLGLASKLADTLDRKYLSRDLRQYRCLISGAGADLEHTRFCIYLEQLSHASDDKRLRDRLIRTDWQGVIAISTTLECAWYERMPRHGTHRFEHALIANAVMITKASHHAFARDRVVLGFVGKRAADLLHVVILNYYDRREQGDG
jgi:hypothetical protein